MKKNEKTALEKSGTEAAAAEETKMARLAFGLPGLMKLLCALVVLFSFGTAQAQAVPVEVDPADAIAQVAATAADLLPYAIALAGAGIVFRLVRRWLR